MSMLAALPFQICIPYLCVSICLSMFVCQLTGFCWLMVVFSLFMFYSQALFAKMMIVPTDTNVYAFLDPLA